MNVLHVDSSITGEASVSRRLSAAVTDRLARQGATVTRLDLAATPFPHLDGAEMAMARAGAEAIDDATAALSARARAALDAFLAADVVVIGAPMYNFGISSQLKAWIDRLAVPGATFRYTEAGPEGLAGGKTVIVASSRGGIYTSGPAAPMDFHETYLRGVFGFFGITDVRFVRAEGLGLGPDAAAKAIEAALAGVAAAVTAPERQAA
ncbi:MAG: NAD(P)H-dependent oxidoreductase [Pseudomonadota bacterium]|nr:NAD(P)H-dependent oxidoreductase [Pseudomonadota bacterium]